MRAQSLDPAPTIAEAAPDVWAADESDDIEITRPDTPNAIVVFWGVYGVSA